MNFSIVKQLSFTALEEILTKAHQIEHTHNIKAIEKTIAPIWADLKTPIDLSEYPPFYQAKLLRVAGYALFIKGQIRGREDFLPLSQDYLIKSSEMYRQINDEHDAREALIILSCAYLHSGKISDAEQIVDDCVSYYLDNITHQNYLLAQVNKLALMFYQKKITEGVALAASLSVLADRCTDLKIKCQYALNTAILYRLYGDLDGAQKILERMQNHFETLDNQRYGALFFNGLALIYKEKRKFDLALENIGKALQISRKHEDFIFQGHFSDTKAQIYVAAGDYDKALHTIKRSVFYFGEGNEYLGLLPAQWWLVKILYYLNRRDEAESEFGRLQMNIEQNSDPDLRKFYDKEIKEFFQHLAEQQSNRHRISKVCFDGYFQNNPGYIGKTFFYLPSGITNLLYGFDQSITVAAAGVEMIPEDKVIFRIEDVYYTGRVLHTGAGWVFEETISKDLVPARFIKYFKKITDVDLFSEMSGRRY